MHMRRVHPTVAVRTDACGDSVALRLICMIFAKPGAGTLNDGQDAKSAETEMKTRHSITSCL